jgi:hypothetical protein
VNVGRCLVRDIQHEQISASTDAELAARVLDIRQRALFMFGVYCYRTDDLREYQRILSEQYCRAVGIPSEPWVTICPPSR